MEKFFLSAIFMLSWFTLFFVQKAFCQDTWEWVRIDCGSDTSYKDANGDTWETDDDYIKTGNNKRVSLNSSSPIDQLNTLRVFTEHYKNCYILPTPTKTRYLIRAMFLYGNYDGLSKPPTFELQFDGNKWATVVTNMASFIYYEMIYATNGDSISICLARTQDQQFPFISRLESVPLSDDMYAQMRRDMAWFKSYRYNYGATDPVLGYPEDKYNRIWEPLIPNELKPVTANFTTLDDTGVNQPPDSVIIHEVQAHSSTDTIELSFSFANVSHLHHVEMYFTEPFLDTSAKRSFNVLVNNDLVANASPQYQSCLSVLANPLSVGTLDVHLVPTDDSTLPPIISAIEIYTVSQPLVTATTPQNDCDGLLEFIDNFDQLKGWSGDPCLPNYTTWQWWNCSGDQPPRVTSISLSGYGLQGYLPDFSHMDALETIDLHNNKLYGEIPDFLGKLPNLRLLDLRNNSFSGDIPPSIIHNKQLTYMIDVPKKRGVNKVIKKVIKIVSIIFASFFMLFLFFCIMNCVTPSSFQERPPPSPPPRRPPPPPPPPPAERVAIIMEETVQYRVSNLG